MSEFVFQSAFNSAPTTSSSYFHQQTDSDEHEVTVSKPKYTERKGNLSSFLCHVIFLQKRLRDDEGEGVFIQENVERITGKTKLGEGSQFNVYSAQAVFRKPLRHLKANESEQFVAVKTVKPNVEASGKKIIKSNWTSILLEVRALMHEHLRYHPNIVRLLGFTWAHGWDSSNSAYPMLIMECARYGSLKSLQALGPKLSFAIKQKLCHDVARGLSILHACGIIHGDMKHENVLVFDNPYDEPPGQPYLAKLADFGGAVMDTKILESQGLKVGTFPYEAPEAAEVNSVDGLKKADVYSFGLLIWRTILDGKGLAEELSIASDTPEAKAFLLKLKQDDEEMLDRALDSITEYIPQETAKETLDLIAFSLQTTLRADPSDRFLAAAQAALRNGHMKGIPEHLAEMKDRNWCETFENPDGVQRQSFNADKVGFLLGKMGDFYDAQQNLPGYRADLPHPAGAVFFFEPMKLKVLLSWKQQVEMVEEFKAAARFVNEAAVLDIPSYKAAFYVFRCYLAEFGVRFDAQEACYWLSLAAEEDEECQDDLFAQAWLWRFCEALKVPQPVSADKTVQYLRNSVVMGFIECEKDWKKYIARLDNLSEKQEQKKQLKSFKRLLRTYAGGMGARHYFPSSIRKQYNFSDMSILDEQIQEELGEHYERYLLATDQSIFPDEDVVENRFDKIYVSTAGHGLLHYAATFGKVDVLKHLLDTYRCDINRGSAFRYDSPLLCAVRSAQYDCALFMLQRGAQANQLDRGHENPLHWLCGFEEEKEEQMQDLAKHLIEAGAHIDELSSSSGTTDIMTDWDYLLNIQTTPLGRAVIKRNSGAMKVLLELGADPRGKNGENDKQGMSPVEIAAMLFYVEELQMLLERINVTENTSLFDEAWILYAAHERRRDAEDPSSLQSRLVHLGSQYKSAILETFQFIRKWNSDYPPPDMSEDPKPSVNDLLYKEVLVGDADIVEALLILDYDPDGRKEARPLQAAVSTRNWAVFKLLLRFGANPNLRYQYAPGVEMTFLHALAFTAHGAAMPDGINIARHLLTTGVLVDLPVEDCPITPFALCVINRYFDIADLLLAHGAELNPVYVQHQSIQGPPVSLLAGLVSIPTEAALEAICYLVDRASHEGKTRPAEGPMHHAVVSQISLESQIGTLHLSPQKLSPIGIPSLNVTILHIIAGWTPDIVTHYYPIPIEIIEVLIPVFSEPSTINVRCPDYGTPLSRAALHMNLDLVSRLLDEGADPLMPYELDPENPMKVLRDLGVECTIQNSTPLCMALLTFEALLMKFEGVDKAVDLMVDQVKCALLRGEKVVKCLLPLDQEEETLQLWASLQERRDDLVTKIGQGQWARYVGTLAGTPDVGLPVDLSVLTEEIPDGWVEGAKMTDEMALRTLLRTLRSDFTWPDP